MSSFESSRFYEVFVLFGLSCFRSFGSVKMSSKKQKGRNGQTKKTGFLLLFYLRLKVRLCLTEQTTMILNRLQHFPFESTTEIRPEQICRRRTWPSSCHTWTCHCCTLNKESRRSVTCKLATLIWSFRLDLARLLVNK